VLSLVYKFIILFFIIVVCVYEILQCYNKFLTKINYIIYSTSKIEIIRIYIIISTQTLATYSSGRHAIILHYIYTQTRGSNRRNQPTSNHPRAPGQHHSANVGSTIKAFVRGATCQRFYLLRHNRGRSLVYCVVFYYTG